MNLGLVQTASSEFDLARVCHNFLYHHFNEVSRTPFTYRPMLRPSNHRYSIHVFMTYFAIKCLRPFFAFPGYGSHPSADVVKCFFIFFLYWQQSGTIEQVRKQLHEANNLFAASTLEKQTRRDKYVCICFCCFVGAYFLDELFDVIEVLRGERPVEHLYQDVRVLSELANCSNSNSNVRTCVWLFSVRG